MAPQLNGASHTNGTTAHHATEGLFGLGRKLLKLLGTDQATVADSDIIISIRRETACGPCLLPLPLRRDEVSDAILRVLERAGRRMHAPEIESELLKGGLERSARTIAAALSRLRLSGILDNPTKPGLGRLGYGLVGCDAQDALPFDWDDADDIRVIIARLIRDSGHRLHRSDLEQKLVDIGEERSISTINRVLKSLCQDGVIDNPKPSGGASLGYGLVEWGTSPVAPSPCTCNGTAH